jgi:DNA replicative helicase MCM subunit Mcm2 (Cdc46/Mcm family)
MEYGEAVHEFEEYFQEKEYEKLAEVIKNEQETIEVDSQELDKFRFELFAYLIKQPEEAISAAEEAIKSQEAVVDEEIKPKFYNLPEADEDELTFKAENIGNLISFGTGIPEILPRNTVIKKSVTFECTQCGSKFKQDAGLKTAKSPSKCECGSKQFEETDTEYEDFREFEIDERITCRTYGKEAREVEDEGREVRIIGILKEKDGNFLVEVHNFEEFEASYDVEDLNEEDYHSAKDEIKGILRTMRADEEVKIKEAVKKIIEETELDQEEASEAIKNLKREGKLFEPKEGYIQTI